MVDILAKRMVSVLRRFGLECHLVACAVCILDCDFAHFGWRHMGMVGDVGDVISVEADIAEGLRPFFFREPLMLQTERKWEFLNGDNHYLYVKPAVA